MEIVENAIDCRGVCKAYPHFNLKELNLTVSTGTVMGFVGPNGAGKSTTLRIILGLIFQDQGEVSVFGQPMPKNQIAAKWDIGYNTVDMRLHRRQTLEFHMQWMASIFPRWDQHYANELLQHFELVATQKMKELSTGQHTKACLLMVLARRPKLLVLDEPTNGLDPVARTQVLDVLSAVRRSEERTILFSSHNTLDVEQISDQITLINRGSVVFTANKEDLLDNWRRFRLQVEDEYTLPSHPDVVSTHQDGHLVTTTVSGNSAQFEALVKDSGATISAAEPLTLEEIFLTSVGRNREVPA